MTTFMRWLGGSQNGMHLTKHNNKSKKIQTPLLLGALL